MVNDDDRRLAEELRAAVGNFVRHVRTISDTLSPAREAVLGHLVRGGPRSITELASVERVRHQSMARTIRDLASLALVDVTADERDRRRAVVVVTEVGRARVIADRGRRTTTISEAIRTKLDSKERQALAALPNLLEKLVS